MGEIFRLDELIKKEMNKEFENGDIIVSEDHTVIGVFYTTQKDLEDSVEFPSFHIAIQNGQYRENFDDLICDWPMDYQLATDEETEIFLSQVEEFTGMVWNTNLKMLERRDESSWKLTNHLYPSTWKEATERFNSCSELEDELFCNGFDNGFSGKMYTLAQLKLLYDIYNYGIGNKKDEVSYAIVSTPWGELECRPYIFGSRNSMFSFKYQEQARLFMTNFEELLKKCANLGIF